MSWGRMDDSFHDHPKVEGLSLEAVGVWTLCWSRVLRHLKTSPTPGFISEAAVKSVAGRRFNAISKELTAPIPGKQHGLWEKVEGGFVFHNLPRYLPRPRDPNEASESGKKGAASRWGNGKTIANSHDSAMQDDGSPIADGMADDGTRASAPAFPSRPVPSPEVVGQVDRGGRLTLSARAEINSLRCTKHQTTPEDEIPPCHGCKRAREQAETGMSEWQTQLLRTSAEAVAARRACSLCNDDGWRENPDGGRPLRRCTHKPEDEAEADAWAARSA